MTNRFWTCLALCGPALAATGCGDEILRRGEDLELPPSGDAVVIVEPQGIQAPDVEVEASVNAVIWLNRVPGKNITVIVRDARLLAGVAANRNVTQIEGAVVTDRALPTGGTASAKFAEPGRYVYEIHGLDAPRTGTITVRPGRRPPGAAEGGES